MPRPRFEQSPGLGRLLRSVRPGRAPVAYYLILVFLVSLNASPAFAQEADLESGLFELSIPSAGVREIVPVWVDERGAVLLSFGQILSLVEIPVHAVADTLHIEWPPDVWSSRIYLPSGAVFVHGEETTRPPPGEWILHEGERWATSDVLAAILQVDAELSWAELRITLRDDGRFPVSRRLAVSRARERADPYERAALLNAPYEARTGGWVANWGVTGITSAGGTSATGRMILGAGVFGGRVDLGTTVAARGAEVDGAVDRISYHRVFPRNRVVRQLAIGEVGSYGVVQRAVRGIAIGNEPHRLPIGFADAVIDPQVPPGWEYEVYQRGRLIGVSVEDGERVAAPLAYGTTPLDVRMIGPAGQVVEQRMRFFVPAAQLPPGEWRWNATAGTCVSAACSTYWQGELRRGVARELTLGIGSDVVGTDTASATRPYLVLSALPQRNLHVDFRSQFGGITRVGASVIDGFGPVRSLRAGVSLSHAQDGAQAAMRPGEWAADLGSTFRVPIGDSERSASTSLSLRGLRAEGIQSTHAGVSTSLARNFVSLRYDGGMPRGDLWTARLHGRPYLSGWGRRYGVTWRAGVGVGGGSLRLIEGGAAIRPGRASHLSATLQWRDRDQLPSLNLRYVLRGGLGLLQTNSNVRPGGSTSLSTTYTGGAGWGALPGWEMLPVENVGLAGVTGRVEQEGPDGPQPAAGIPVMVGSIRAITDDRGVYRAWRVQPYDAISVRVDTLNLQDPTWTPAAGEVILRPTPHMYNRVDFDLVRTREIVGEVRSGPNVRTAAGATVLFFDDAAGDTVGMVRTFSDGTFYLPRIRPGVYRAEIDERSLQVLQAVGDPVRFEVPRGGAGPVYVPLIELRTAGESLEGELLDPGSRRITGIVRSASTGDPIEASLIFGPVDSAGVQTLDTDVSGSFAIPTAVNPYRLTATARAHDPHSVVANPGDSVVIELEPLPADSVRIPFAFDRFTLGPRGTEAVERAAHLAKGTTGAVDIRGHTDAAGADAYNVRLSQNRAQTVARILTELGVEEGRILIRGFGPFQPIDTNRTAVGKAANRRVEVIVTKDGTSP